MSTRTLQLCSNEGKPYRVEIPPPGPQKRSGYAFALYKSGSSLMFSMLQSYAERKGLGCFSLYDAAFQQGVETHRIQEDARICFEDSGYLYLGFRHYPSFSLSLDDAPSLLLVRDPRDILVSLYFSVRESHVIPDGNMSLHEERKRVQDMDISEFVLQRSDYLRIQFENYRRNLLHRRNLKVYRYEDVIFGKRRWLLDMLDWLDLPVSRKLAREVADQYDVLPEQEDPSSHVRRVHPGDHREKLSQAVIGELNSQLDEFLAEFDYPDFVA